MDIAVIVQKIQYVLAPAVMISSAALLLSGYQNKFSSLSSRFRALNQEKRLLSQEPQRSRIEEARLENILHQMHNILKRATYAKNAIVLTYLAIICFTGTSVLIFINLYTVRIDYWIIGVFLAGLVLILLSAVLMMIETAILYRVIMLEKKV